LQGGEWGRGDGKCAGGPYIFLKIKLKKKLEKPRANFMKGSSMVSNWHFILS